MSAITAPAVKNRTIVRSKISARLIALRAGFTTLDLVAPTLAGRWAARLWCTLPVSRERRDDRPIPGLHAPPDTVTSIMTPGGRRVAVETWGSGPPVYLVHGWGGWRGQLGGFVEPFVQRGYAVVAHDALSHGESGPGQHGPRRTHGLEMVDALSAVVDTFGPPAGIVAHSLGSAITAFAIDDGMKAPPKLAFVAPTVGPLPDLARLVRALGLSPRAQTAMYTRLEAMVGRPVADFDMLAIDRPMPPTLVVHDSADKEVPYAESARLVETWPSADLWPTDGLGHRRILRDRSVIETVTEYIATR